MPIKWGPCMNCTKETRSHSLFPGLNLCHECWTRLNPAMIDKLSKKAAKIASEWVRMKLQTLMIERDIWLKKRMELGRKSSVHKAGVLKPRKIA